MKNKKQNDSTKDVKDADSKAESSPQDSAEKENPHKKSKEKFTDKIKKDRKKDSKKDLEARLLRLQADFDNFRKRTLREKSELYQRANEDIMTELVPSLDHLDLALQSIQQHKSEKAIIDGIKMVSNQILLILQKFGLTPIEADKKEFDPNHHEAVSHITSEDVPENMIIAETRKGYMLGSKVLRASQVVVSSGKEE